MEVCPALCLPARRILPIVAAYLRHGFVWYRQALASAAKFSRSIAHTHSSQRHSAATSRLNTCIIIAVANRSAIRNVVIENKTS
jgi:hypothetical protein